VTLKPHAVYMVHMRASHRAGRTIVCAEVLTVELLPYGTWNLKRHGFETFENTCSIHTKGA
jgi:hypothetical protein